MKSNSEIEYLNELIKDFPPKASITVNDAFALLSARYEALEKNISPILKVLKNPDPQFYRFPFNKIIIEKDYFPAVFYLLVFRFHRYLFNEILSNAGKFRKHSDKNNGLVGFGGNSPRVIGTFKFTGTTPIEIPKKLKETFQILRSNSKNPLRSGLEFYRRFVYIHPFYDANGRIGRLILVIYLKYFGLSINWQELENGGNMTKFIKKINACHKRENQQNYPQYFGYFYNHFKKFVVEIKQFDK